VTGTRKKVSRTEELQGKKEKCPEVIERIRLTGERFEERKKGVPENLLKVGTAKEDLPRKKEWKRGGSWDA